MPPDAPEASFPTDGRLMVAIVESAEDAIVSKTLDGVVTSWNPGAERLFGYSADEMVGRPITLLAAPGSESDFGAILEKIGRGERVEHFETTRRRKDGGIVHVSISVSPVRDEGGVTVNASKIARDVTRRRVAELAARERLGEAGDPLSAILYAVRLLRAGGYGVEEAAWATVDRQVDQLRGLVMDALANLEGGGTP